VPDHKGITFTEPVPVTVPCGLLNDVVKVPPSLCVRVNVIVEEPESLNAVIVS